MKSPTETHPEVLAPPMPYELSNLDYHYLVRADLKALVGAHINKVHELAPGRFRFQFRAKGQGRLDLIVEIGVRAHLTRVLEDAPDTPTQFAMRLRKRLDNARVETVEQLGFDRVLRLGVTTKTGPAALVLELLPGGNVLLLDEAHLIQALYERKEYADRVLERGKPYPLPPNLRLTPDGWTAASLQDAQGVLREAVPKLWRLSPFYAEEAMIRAQIDPGWDAGRLTDSQRQRLCDEALSLLDAGLDPKVYLYEGKPAFPSPISLSKTRAECESFPTYCEALDRFYGGQIAARPEHAEAKKAAKRDNERLLRAINGQRHAIEQLRLQADEVKLSGDRLFALAHAVDAALELARKGADAKKIYEETGLTVKVGKKELDVQLPDD